MVASDRAAGPLVELQESNIATYLRGRGLIEDDFGVSVRTLSGGYVNNVYRVESRDQILILKQSLAVASRTVLEAPIERALAEVAAMKAIKRFLGPSAPIPDIIDDDPENYVSVMTSAPDDSVLYENELLDGRFHHGTGARIGLYAANLHAATEGVAEIAKEFGANPGFALRDQSIRSAGGRNPDFIPLIEAMLNRNREEACALIDADITPKNILVHQAGITKLDFECAQWGDPAFDLGIIVAHFILLGFACPQWRKELLAEAQGCCEAYVNARPEKGSANFLPQVFRYASVMMLGRADGDFVFNYLSPHRPALQGLIRQWSVGPTSLDDALELASATLMNVAEGGRGGLF